MFSRDAEPIGNVPPYKRISINDPAPTEVVEKTWMSVYGEAVEQAHNHAEHDRIWALVKGAAEGTNITAREYEAPAEDVA